MHTVQRLAVVAVSAAAMFGTMGASAQADSCEEHCVGGHYTVVAYGDESVEADISVPLDGAPAEVADAADAVEAEVDATHEQVAHDVPETMRNLPPFCVANVCIIFGG